MKKKDKKQTKSKEEIIEEVADSFLESWEKEIHLEPRKYEKFREGIINLLKEFNYYDKTNKK